MPAGEQVPLKPALALVLAEHLHDAPVLGEELIVRDGLGDPLAVGGLEDGREPVGDGLVGAEDAEVAALAVEVDHVAQECPEHSGVLGVRGPGSGDVDGIRRGSRAS